MLVVIDKWSPQPVEAMPFQCVTSHAYLSPFCYTERAYSRTVVYTAWGWDLGLVWKRKWKNLKAWLEHWTGVSDETRRCTWNSEASGTASSREVFQVCPWSSLPRCPRFPLAPTKTPSYSWDTNVVYRRAALPEILLSNKRRFPNLRHDPI